MSSLCPLPCLLAPALLLAILVLPVLPRAATGQEITTAAPDATSFANATATANATNATEWVMPPEVDALFPKDVGFDDRLWANVQRESTVNNSTKYSEQLRLINRNEDTYEICNDILNNINLFGGVYLIGCNSLAVHHSYQHVFTIMNWDSVDPREYVSIIKNIYLYKQLQKTTSNQEGSAYLWNYYAPIIKRLLYENPDKIKMQKIFIDIDGDGKKESIFRFAINPYNECINSDNSIGLNWTYYMSSETSYSHSFNSEFSTKLPFFYKNHLFFIERNSVYNIIFVNSNLSNKSTECVSNPVCSFSTN